jgi:hypothetical protein
MNMEPLYPLVSQFGYSVNKSELRQTLAESTITCSLPHGKFTIHYGHRHGLPIVLIETHDQREDELSAIWHDHERMVKA